MKKIISMILILMLVFSMTIPVAATEDTPHNYITNGSFEMGPGGQWGAIAGWTMNIPVGSMDLYIGNYYYDVGRDAFPSDTYIALRKEANPDGDPISITQTITDLPVGVYEFSAWMWSASNTDYFTISLDSGDDQAEIEGFPGVRDYDYTEIAVKSGTLTITIEADNVDKSRFMDALADDLKLIKIKGEEAFATPTPTQAPTQSPDASQAPTETQAPEASDPGADDITPTKNPDNSGNNQEDSIVLPIVLAIVVVVLSAVIIVLVVKLRKKK
ncbi:MAG: hypothetical protein IKU26_08810 [Clostridia bacterium]|nr:hypothetical protein [Clostridia bacterium]